MCKRGVINQLICEIVDTVTPISHDGFKEKVRPKAHKVLKLWPGHYSCYVGFKRLKTKKRQRRDFSGRKLGRVQGKQAIGLILPEVLSTHCVDFVI